MNKFFTAIVLTFFTATSFAQAAPAPDKGASSPQVKEVCRDKKGKDGKTKTVCKKVKIHKKLDGKPVPQK